MKAWQIDSAKVITLNDYTLTLNEDDQNLVKIKITKTLVTSGDIALFNGALGNSFPVIPCRIAVGLVSEVPHGCSLLKNTKVLLSPYHYNSSTKNYSYFGLNKNGYLADYQLVPIECVYPIPEGVVDDEALLADYVALALKVFSVLPIQKQEYVNIFGAGYFGLILAQLALYYQSIPIIIDTNEERLELARNFGTYFTVQDIESARRRIIQLTAGNLADAIVIDSDSAFDLEQTASTIKCGGKLAIVGKSHLLNNSSLKLSTILKNKLTVFGIQNGQGEIATALNHLALKSVSLAGMVTQTINFENAGEFFMAQKPNEPIAVIVNC